MLKKAFYKHEKTGKVTEHAIHECDAASAIARFPHQWSWDADKFGEKLKDGEEPTRVEGGEVKRVPIV